MTAEQIATITMLAKLLEYFREWPFTALFVIIVIGPWVLSIVLAVADRKRLDKVTASNETRFAAAVKMYQDNVVLVQNYERLSEDLHDVVILNTQVMTELVQSIKTNQFCPMVRLDVRTRGILDE